MCIRDSTGLEQGQRQIEFEFCLLRLGFYRFAQGDDFGMWIKRRRLLVRRCFIRGFTRLHAMLFQEFADLAFRHRAGEAVHDLATLDQEDGGHRTDLEGRGDFLFLVHVDLGQHEAAVVLAGQLFQDRTQGLARPAPGCPEVHQYGGLLGFLQDFGFEGLGNGVENVG